MATGKNVEVAKDPNEVGIDSPQPTSVEKVRALPWSMGGSAAIAVFNQFTFFDSGYVLFLNELGLVESQISFLLSLLSFLGVLAVFIAPAIARMGYKRVFIRFWTGRNLVTVLLVLSPWVATTFGRQAVLVYIAGAVLLFAFFRTIAETALLSWQQEYIPRSIQGKFFATNNIFVSLVSVLAVAIAGFVIGNFSGLERFSLLILAGVLFGLLSSWSFGHLPGGAPDNQGQKEQTNLGGIRYALHDRDFVLFLGGVAMIVIATGSVGSFIPLFMRDQAGLNTGNVVFLQNGSLIGGLLSSYLWGWAADRYGSKPVMLWGVYLLAILPLLWFLMPRQTGWSFPAALAIAFVQGMASIGWGIGLSRLFFVSLVPPEKKSDYMALYYAWVSITSGTSALFGGWVLDISRDISGHLLFIHFDSYFILFMLGWILPLAGVLMFRNVRADSPLTTSQFAGLFLRGNLFLAMESLISFYAAKDERSTISTTERLGKAQSPLTVDELLRTLADPRFNVRFEAIVSIARRTPDDRLLEALAEVLHSSDPALSVVAAWAMGRIGDRRSIRPLREGLNSTYRSVRGHCARALGTLGDWESAPELLNRLESEQDEGLRVTYACALGILGEERAVPVLLAMLRDKAEELPRRELALALARIVGNEHYFITLLRQGEVEPGSVLSRAVSRLKKKLMKLKTHNAPLLARLDECADTFARENLEAGAVLFCQALRLVESHSLPQTCWSILSECIERLDETGAGRLEYLLLALHTLYACRKGDEHFR